MHFANFENFLRWVRLKITHRSDVDVAHACTGGYHVTYAQHRVAFYALKHGNQTLYMFL